MAGRYERTYNTSKPKFIRALLAENGRMAEDDLIDAILAQFGEPELVDSVRRGIKDDIRHALTIKDADGFHYAKRHGEIGHGVWVLLSGHATGEAATVIRRYRDRAISARRQGWKHVQLFRRLLKADLAEEMTDPAEARSA